MIRDVEIAGHDGHCPFFAQIVQNFQLEKDICLLFNPSATAETDNIATPIIIKPYAHSHVEISASSPKQLLHRPNEQDMMMKLITSSL